MLKFTYKGRFFPIHFHLLERPSVDTQGAFQGRPLSTQAVHSTLSASRHRPTTLAVYLGRLL
jgi:hypothetical protein